MTASPSTGLGSADKDLCRGRSVDVECVGFVPGVCSISLMAYYPKRLNVPSSGRLSGRRISLGFTVFFHEVQSSWEVSKNDCLHHGG
jgi:hypothetical protein